MRQIPQHTFPLFLLQEVNNDNAMSNASNLVTWEGLLDEHELANANKIIGMEDDDDDEEQISDNEDMGASPAGQSEPFLLVNVGTTTGGGVSKYYFDTVWSKNSILNLILTLSGLFSSKSFHPNLIDNSFS